MAINAALEKSFKKEMRNKQALSNDDYDIITSLRELKSDLDYLYNKLDQTVNPILIDIIIYELKVVYKKYEYYLGICKEKGIKYSLLA